MGAVQLGESQMKECKADCRSPRVGSKLRMMEADDSYPRYFQYVGDTSLRQGSYGETPLGVLAMAMNSSI
jgi:hypothetical protein